MIISNNNLNNDSKMKSSCLKKKQKKKNKVLARYILKVFCYVLFINVLLPMKKLMF